MESKTCNICNINKDILNFYPKRENKKGVRYMAHCKKCHTDIYHKTKHLNKEKRRESQFLYSEKNKEIIQERNRKWRERRRNDIINFLGGKCVSCGFSDNRALQVDHINGGGGKDRRENNIGPVNKLFQDVVKNPNKYQLLCANCNWIKRVENKEYPNVA